MKFEYCMLSLPERMANRPDQIAEKLDGYGEDGWELVAVNVVETISGADTRTDSMVFYFKRRTR